MHNQFSVEKGEKGNNLTIIIIIREQKEILGSIVVIMLKSPLKFVGVKDVRCAWISHLEPCGYPKKDTYCIDKISIVYDFANFYHIYILLGFSLDWHICLKK